MDGCWRQGWIDWWMEGGRGLKMDAFVGAWEDGRRDEDEWSGTAGVE